MDLAQLGRLHLHDCRERSRWRKDGTDFRLDHHIVQTCWICILDLGIDLCGITHLVDFTIDSEIQGTRTREKNRTMVLNQLSVQRGLDRLVHV